jgi:hypothetical protein
MPIAPARVAWYVTGRFYEDPEGRLQDLGYLLHLSGVDAPLFTAPPEASPGEATALLTFRSQPFTAQTIINGNLSLGLDTVGEFSLYLNREGGASFDDPDSFSRGQKIATFRRVSVVMGETLASPIPGGLAISTNVFSADLLASTPFELGGFWYNLRDLLPHGITQWGNASANLLPALPAYPKILAFTGSAVAAG